MKYLDVILLQKCGLHTPINQVSFLLDNLDKNSISHTPWASFKYVPNVKFVLAYGADAIFIKYFVEEKFIKASIASSNGAVHEDACVELFISFEDEKAYYNLEFNCIGTALVGYGETKEGRELQPEYLIKEIRYQSIITNPQQGNNVHWQLTIIIPFTLFKYSNLSSLEGKKGRANFYKCGDHLPTPHYISWSDIKSAEPNFHLPQFFGSLQFK